MTARGSSLIECMVAVAIFGLIASAVAQTVIGAQRGRQLSETWMRATEFATQRIEAVQAGVVVDDQPINGTLQRETTLTAIPDHPGLVRLKVTVTWADPEPSHLALSTMIRR